MTYLQESVQITSVLHGELPERKHSMYPALRSETEHFQVLEAPLSDPSHHGDSLAQGKHCADLHHRR